MFDFQALKKDLEEFRQNEMSPFQKINAFFTNFINDAAYYYINCKRPYSLEDTFVSGASMDFVHRQLQIQIEDHLFRDAKESELKAIDHELHRVLSLMDMEIMTFQMT